MPRPSLTHKQYVEKVKEIHGDDISVLGKYSKTNVKIQHKHSCGHVWSPQPRAILQGQSCPKCANKALAKKLGISHKEYVDMGVQSVEVMRREHIKNI